MNAFTNKQAQTLIGLARQSIQAEFDQSTFNLELFKDDFNLNQGCFTTIYLGGKLKGCIGFPLPDTPLYQAVNQTAISAAFKDPRFSPLSENELVKARIELNILSPLELIEVSSPSEYPPKVEIGKHGLYVINQFNRKGLLLPDVASRYQWDAKEFLNQTCIKANLPKIAWIQDPGLEIYRFTSLIIKEIYPKGDIKII